jgi:hypothetical protein
MDRAALDRSSRFGEALCAVTGKEPRQCLKCHRRFYNSIFYPEGRYGCRWHNCDRINHVTRRASIYEERPALIERVLNWLANKL